MIVYRFKCECGNKFEIEFYGNDVVDYARCTKCWKFAKRISTLNKCDIIELEH